MAVSNTRPQRMFQNFHIIWLDPNIDEVNNEDCRNSIIQLKQVVNTVNTFVDVDQCIDFITDIDEAQTFLIASEKFTELVIPVAQDIRQITSIYILLMNKTSGEKLTSKCHKVSDIFTDISSICQAIKNDVRSFNRNAVSISFVKKAEGVSPKQSLDALDKSFMYTQILKEILLTIDFEQIHIKEFLAYCRQLFIDNPTALSHLNRIEAEYHDHEPIWWYTYQSFLYSILNRALRLMEVDIIIKIGFFLKDLHNHIVKLHSQQFNGHHDSKPFIVYRGQGLSQSDFNELQQTQGGLLSFNNFISTSLDRAVSFMFAETILSKPDMIGILFQMTIHSSIHSSQFARVKDVSYYKEEDEILFSMHSIFRISDIKQLDDSTRLWQVDLILTSDNDPQLHKLTEHIRQETFPHQQGWKRLGHLLIKLGELDKAEQVCVILLPRTTDEQEKGGIYHILGIIKDMQGKYDDAVQYYQQSNKILQKFPSPTRSDLAYSYTSLGSVYHHMGEYSKALSYHEKSLEILKKTLPECHPGLATSYNNIGSVYHHTGQCSKALSYYEKAFETLKKTLPAYHPLLATSYHNIGSVYRTTGGYSKALSFFEKALEISKKTLPEYHSDLATSYDNVGSVYHHTRQYSKALSFYEKGLKTYQKTLPAHHPDLAISYNNIGLVHYNMGEYAKALSCYEKAIETYQKTLPEYHPLLATSYNNIGSVYYHTEQYSKTLLFYEKALEIFEKTLPEYHPDLATSYNNIAFVYYNKNNYRKALQYFERALDVFQRSLPSNHPHIKSVKENIAIVKTNCN